MCDYTPSKRGQRRRPKESDPSPRNLASRASPFYIPESSTWDSAVADLDTPLESLGTIHATAQPTQSAAPTVQDNSITQDSNTLPSATWFDDEQLVSLFYLNFHTSHPILVPKSLYGKRGYPRCVKAVVEFIGSQFSTNNSSDTLRNIAAREIECGKQEIPEMVQARTLFTIALFARNEIDDGSRMLVRATDIAIGLGMHKQDFAAQYAKNSAAEEESMRKTWYELFVVDGCIAAFQRKSSFKTNSVNADVILPCDDGINDGETYPCVTATRADFESSIFSDQDMVFSSSCYRIEAVRLLGRVLAIAGAHGVHRDRVQAIDNALAAFIHHLPSCKSQPEIINTYGELDELMFQTHLIIQYATILLHFPRSDLTSPAAFTNVVPGTNSAKLVCPCNHQRIHSIKAIDASKTLSMLAALRSPVHRHTPFFIWTLALGATVQLAVSAMHSKSSRNCLEEHCDRVKLMLGVLKSCSRYWFTAKVVLRALNRMALPVFEPLRQGLPKTTAQQDEVMGGDLEACIYETPTSAPPWPEDFDFQNIQELIGFDTNDFCL
ncbi:hypothetical protein ACEQ8H_007214 [Pleosporales sp. CAS-2024a]